MRRKAENSEGIGGQDSFLDIVANLVGILIILVVIVSAQAKSSRLEANDNESLVKEIEDHKVQLKNTRRLVEKVTADNYQLENDIRNEKNSTKLLADERHAKLMQMELVKQEIERRTKDWSSDQQANFENQIKLERLRDQLTGVQRKIKTWDRAEVTRIEKIQHFPTPIAKTVFTEEVHFRLQEGKISFVPIERLVDQMKSEWKVVAQKLQNTDRVTSMVGPRDGYRLQYELVTKTHPTEGYPSGIEFDHFVILPVPGCLEERIDDSFFHQSQFLNRVSSLDPGRTTISIWVYPDSFGEFVRLKEWLHTSGFQIASWPLDKGRPISGGPNGFKTSAQ